MTGETVTVRRCRATDLDQVLELWAAARSPHASTADRREDLERLLRDDEPAELLVAGDAGRVRGAVIAGWDGWRGNLYRLAVDPGHRRAGVGLALVRAAEAYFHSRGGRRVTALVAYDDDRAGAFWDAAGYPRDREIGRRVRNL